MLVLVKSLSVKVLSVGSLVLVLLSETVSLEYDAGYDATLVLAAETVESVLVLSEPAPAPVPYGWDSVAA